MNKFKQILVSAIIAVLLAITFFFLIGEPESEIVGIIAFILMILHYRKKNKEERRKAEEEERQKAEAERKRKEEERQKAEAERKRKEEEERQKAEAERKRKEEEESFDWDYDQSSQTLTISGQGHMPNDWHPWGTLYVKRIILKDGITSISENAFSRDNLNARREPLRIDFGNTLQEIKDRAFDGQSLSDCSFVLPASLLTIGDEAFAEYYHASSHVTFCFRSQEPPSLKGNPFRYIDKCMMIIPTGCLKKYLTLSCWQKLASSIKEKDVSLMLSSLELEAIKVENKHKEEEKRKEEEERQKAEEKRRREEERRKAAEEEKKRKEEEERQKAEEEEFKSEYEAELRKKMGL